MLEKLPLATIKAMLDTLPIDLTLIDDEDRIIWCSGHRIFSRPPEIIGRDVRHCHQESSHPAIDRMIADFKIRARDAEEHVVDKADGRRLHIRYMAVRDSENHYLGLVEMVQELKPPDSLQS